MELTKLLSQFSEVFQEKITLPPERSQVHQIKLIPEHKALQISLSPEKRNWKAGDGVASCRSY